MKKRLDVLVTEGGYAQSREKAKAMIMSGIVYVDGIRCDKAGMSFDESAVIELRGEKLRYVSRGGLKLEKALQVFPVTVEGKVCLDIGSSTGGFNIRYVEPDDLPEYASFASIDVSFISLIKVLIPVRNLLEEDGEIICLIKPQFEAGRDQVGKHGVVRDPLIQIDVIRRITAYARTAGLEPVRLDYSPIRGPEGNIEYLCCLKKKALESDPEVTEEDILKAVKEAHETLS